MDGTLVGQAHQINRKTPAHAALASLVGTVVDPGHCPLHRVVVLRLALDGVPDLGLGIGDDDVVPHRAGLAEMLHPQRDRRMAMHRAQRKRIVYLDGDAIVAEQGEFKKRLELADIPVTANGTIGFQIEKSPAIICLRASPANHK